MNSFLENHVRHLDVDEIRDYAHLEGLPPLLQECIAAFDKGLQEKEGRFEDELGEQDEKTKEDLRHQFNELKRNLLQMIRTSSYEELEPKVQSELARFQLMMVIREE